VLKIKVTDSSDKKQEYVEKDPNELNRLSIDSYYDLNKKNQKKLENEYMNVRNLAIIIIDLIPYNLKDNMVEKLRILLGDQKDGFGYEKLLDNIGDIKIDGFRTWSYVGIVYNSDLKSEIWEGYKRDIPKPFVSIEISIGQLFDFYYYIIYTCNIKDEYQTKNIKETFIHMDDMVENKEFLSRFSHRGPDLEPNIREYQKLIENYLKEFSCGLFLNNNNLTLNIPNIKILSIEKIDFNNFEDWEIAYRSLLRFLGYHYYYSRYDNYLISSSEDVFHITKMGYGSEYVFLASENDFDYGGYADLDTAIVYKVKNLIEVKSNFYFCFLTYCWIIYQLKNKLIKWEEIINEELKKLRLCDKLKDIIKIHNNMLEQKNDFDTYYNEEFFNNMEMSNSIKNYDIGKLFTPIKYGNITFNISTNISRILDGLINYESVKLEEIKKNFESFFNYSANITNMYLNKNNRKMQRLAITIAVIAIIISVIGIYLNYNLALSDFVSTHPKGNYIITVSKLGYNKTSKCDIYRIQFVYYGRGESKYLTLNLGLTGINPTIRSKGNCEVMEPNIIVVRNYVDGLIGWVDYEIKRLASIETGVIILDSTSDVDIKINDIT